MGTMVTPIDALRRYREQQDLTQPEAAEALGVSRETYNRYENGRRLIPAKRLGPIEQITGVMRRDLRPDLFAEPAE